MSAIQLFDKNGELRFDGTEVGGGGSQPVTEAASISGDQVTVTNGGDALLPINFLDLGDDLFDFTDPTSPAAKKAGLFSIHAQIHPVAWTAGGVLVANLTFDANGDAPYISNSAVGGVGTRPDVLLSGCWKLAAGDVIQIQVFNDDGVADRDISVKNCFASRVGPA